MLKRFYWCLIALISISLMACSTSPTGRKQLILLPDSQLDEMGVASFQEMKAELPQTENEANIKQVECIADRIINVLPDKYRNQAWEVRVFEDDQVNAFALPGYKIGVYTGLIKIADNASQLAAVMGHEVAHVLARHGNERVSTQLATSQALNVTYELSGEDSKTKQAIFQGLGIGAQIGIILPFSRTHETEADEIGLELMAKAGFDPRESVKLWQNMSKLGDSKNPEFLSTHPSNESRIRDLNAKMTSPLANYLRLKEQNNIARCE
ncbi:M48 family metallopeptidase [Marinomonas aquiplantarum]|uniref:Peptidase M48-like protein n=1 Tax=Marinomonas aquiplantarum TaxID=491951 RepID=A0A366D3B9_9GAMM|nr:M48 family metallopeptidase [Marinomonas aquiplantarum]RBO83999.1 peptidase M48-like protein [Marinomonas aquiplantarum]